MLSKLALFQRILRLGSLDFLKRVSDVPSRFCFMSTWKERHKQ